MLTNLLVNAADKTRTVSIGEAALYALLGYAVVFLGIAFLILVVWLVGKSVNKMKTGTKRAVAKAPEMKAPTQSVSASSKPEEITDETVAILMAAIMAYYQQTNPKCEFTVKRIKRI